MPRRKQAGAEETNEEMLSLDQAAQRLGVSRSTLQRMLRQGNIRGFKVGRQWRLRHVDLTEFAKMAHPSAAGVNVGELERLTDDLAKQAGVTGELVFDPALPEYPSTEQEVAVENLLRTLLLAAAKDQASDIHMDPIRSNTYVRFRIDGVLHQVMEFPRYGHKPLAVCVKAHAGIPLDQDQTAQDGRFNITIDGAEYDVRTATIPSVYGESVAMRLLNRQAQAMTLDSAHHGMTPADLARYQRALVSPCGMIVVAGPTGCGKTTMLYAGLQYIASPEIKTITVEDPVEYAFRWVTQAPVNVKAGFTYEQAVRAVQRHDPDVVMVGELRTGAAVPAIFQLALTGHLVLSTLHASSAAGAVQRLLGMAPEPFMLADSLLCLVSMRLVRIVCSECAQPDQPSFSVLSSLAERARKGGYELPESPKFMRGAGCTRCHSTGYYSRTGIYEVMLVTPEIRHLIASHASAEEIHEEAIKSGTTTLTADGLRKAAEGVTTVAEVARLLPPGQPEA